METNAVALFECAFSNADFGMALTDDDLNFVLFNEKYAELAFAGTLVPKIGDNAADVALALLESGVYALPDGLDIPAMKQTIIDAMTSCQSEFDLPLTDGRYLTASSKRTPLGGYLLTVNDTTHRKLAEEARWRAVNDAVGSLEEGFALWDADFRFTMCNDKYVDIVIPYRDTPFEVGTSVQTAMAEGFQSGVYDLPDDMTEDAYVDGLMDRVRSPSGPLEIKFKDGRIIVVSAKDTELGGLLITALDVTEERNTRKKARDMLYDAMETREEGFGLWDSEMRFLMCNQNYVDIVLPYRGHPLVVGSSVADGVREIFQAGLIDFPIGLSEDDLVSDIENWVRSFGVPREFNYKDGRVVVMSVKPTTLGAFQVTALDVTEARNSAAKARDMLLDAFQTLDEGLILCDEDMNYVFSNDAWKKMMFEGFEGNTPLPGESVLENLSKHIHSGFYAIPDGMTPDDYFAWMMGELSGHQNQVRYSSTDGRHFEGSSHQTALGGALIFVRDVTRQEKAEEELRQQRETAHQNEKLSALGELLAGVAHELNNPLSVVFGYSQMLQGKIADPVLSERVDLICQSSERAAKIVRTFLAMARQRPTKMEPCSVNDIVETALEVSSYSLKSNGTEVAVELDKSNPFVLGDFDQLAQVFSNLIVNAGHAVGEKGAGGKIAIRGRISADQIEIEVADNGKGIPEDIHSRIFEPFFTTKDVGDGTGIGLAFSHRIVQGHAGTLTVKSKVGKGTQFYVRLAMVDGQKPATDEPKLATDAGRSVLVIDDEDSVARLIADMLMEEGFLVTKTTDPRAALSLAENRQFDVVLSDFKMPQMNGETFFRALEVIAPENAKRTGFITGDAMSDQVLRFLRTSKRPHIEKPIMKSELLVLITHVIETAE